MNVPKTSKVPVARVGLIAGALILRGGPHVGQSAAVEKADQWLRCDAIRSRRERSPGRHARVSLFVVAMMAALLLPSCRSSQLPERTPAAELELCQLPGVSREARCGTLTVPETRTSVDGRNLQLHVTIVGPADADAPKEDDPIFLLAGGPGQGAAQLAPQLFAQLEPVARGREIVFIDQRGTGRSNPLNCDPGFGIVHPEQVDALRRCRDELEARADLRQYGTAAAVEDLESVRRALGYDAINIVGVSYGTRQAFEYLRAYPRNVRSLVLRAVAPPGFNIVREGIANAERELQRVISDCAADEACRDAFPNLGAELAAVRAAASPSPTITVEGAAGIDSASLNQTLYALLLNPATRQQIPLLIHRAAESGLQTLAPIVNRVVEGIYGSVSAGMYLSVLCGEDVPHLTTEDLEALKAPLGGLGRWIADACDSWTPVSASPSLHQPIRSDVPILLVSGERDPSTTLETAERLARELPSARHLVLPGIAHAPLFPGCTADLVEAFLDDPSGRIDTGCLGELSLPPFAVPQPANP